MNAEGATIEDQSTSGHASFITRHAALFEIALIFAVFFLEGASPVPDINEPYYLGKAIHFWNPDWVQGDFFLDSADTHQVFYFTFGWLSLWLAPPVLAWCGRILTWALLAWAWQRLSFAVLPRPWWAVLTAALLVALNQWCHLAGEWVVGGVEAKGFAYVLVFLGLEALIRNRWNRAWVLLGAAAAFHVLVGGWAVAAAGFAWLAARKDRPPSLRSMWPGLLAGLLLSLPGLLPALQLTWGVDRPTIDLANQIYVYQRLPHHLDFVQIPLWFKIRFALLIAATAVVAWLKPCSPAMRRLVGFGAGTLVIAAVGVMISCLSPGGSAWAAGLLRFYWFRLADILVPATFAILAAVCLSHALRSRRRWGRIGLTCILAAAAIHVGDCAIERSQPMVPRADRLTNYGGWWRACHWIAQPGNIPPHARFLTPRLSQTFKWYAGRAEVVNMKEVPQDARAIVEWWRRLMEIHGTGSNDPATLWHEWLTELGPARLQQLGAKYQADYVITLATPRLPLQAVYENETYIVYRLGSGKEVRE
jgi:hypothetical protein